MNVDELVGTYGTWALPIKDGDLNINGFYLGFSTSESANHSPLAHPSGFPPGKNVATRINFRTKLEEDIRCSACRWTEFMIFREQDEESSEGIRERPYLVHFAGISVLPDEASRFRFERSLTAIEVVEILTTRRGGRAYLSVPAGRVLAQAASFDKCALTEAYNNRLVV